MVIQVVTVSRKNVIFTKYQPPIQGSSDQTRVPEQHMLEIRSTSPELRSSRPWGWHTAQNRSASSAGLRRLGCFLQKKDLVEAI